MENIHKIIFFNFFHNGDIFASRTFIKKIIDHIKKSKPNTEFFYVHKNSPLILLDIPDLTITTKYLPYITSEYSGDFIIGEHLFIPTWYACNKRFYMNQYDVSFDCLYTIFQDICQRNLGFSLTDISTDPIDFFPDIDYTYYNTKNITEWLSKNPNKKVFVSNCAALSGQTGNINLVRITHGLAKRFPNHIFILTNKEGQIITDCPNVIYSKDIIKFTGFDLNENAFLSNHCDVIVGPCSGSFSFSINKTNYFQRNPKIIALYNTPGKLWLNKIFSDKITYSADILVSSDTNETNITNLIISKL